MIGKFVKRWFTLILLLIGLITFFYFNLGQYLNFTTLKQHREMLQTWTHSNYIHAVVLFMIIYIIAVFISIPGATFLTLVGGFLFGIFWGTMYVVFSATVGATCLFLAVQTAFGPSFAKKTSSWVMKMRKGFQEGAFSYLLILRLVPLFPFWVVNIVAALLGVPIATFILTTLIGIIPGSMVFVALGNGFGHLFDQNQTPNMKIIFDPQILIPLLALAFLALMPILYKKIKKRSK